jgi:alkylation response protein AidB-like acyl-CoA dehydrogenase
MVAPVIMAFGTPEQQQRHLPGIMSGEVWWSQGYSEPGSGSDLASLKCKAERRGDKYIVNGQKTWTTLAMDANWCFLLVRTDKAAKKQEGISFLLVDMATPGITVKPIINLEYHDEFCEVFFDNVRVPARNLVGTPNRGWDMAKALLSFERIYLGSPRLSAYAFTRLRQLAERMGVWDDAAFQETYGRLRLDLEDLKSLYGSFVDKLRRGETLGPDVSMLKIFQTELFQRITDTMLEIAGENAGLLEPMEGNRNLNPTGLYIQARPATIYGGSNEIQRNILSKNVLGLPG